MKTNDLIIGGKSNADHITNAKALAHSTCLTYRKFVGNKSTVAALTTFTAKSVSINIT